MCRNEELLLLVPSVLLHISLLHKRLQGAMIFGTERPCVGISVTSIGAQENSSSIVIGGEGEVGKFPYYEVAIT